MAATRPAGPAPTTTTSQTLRTNHHNVFLAGRDLRKMRQSQPFVKSLELIDVRNRAIGQAPKLLARVGNHQNSRVFPPLKFVGPDGPGVAEAQVDAMADFLGYTRGQNHLDPRLFLRHP